MSFTIEYGDAFFKIFSPDKLSFSGPVHYYDYATIEWHGRLYACFLSGDEEEEDMTVFDITDGAWGNAQPVETTAEAVEFEGENDGLVEVECGKCDGDGFYFEKDPNWRPAVEVTPIA